MQHEDVLIVPPESVQAFSIVVCCFAHPTNKRIARTKIANNSFFIVFTRNMLNLLCFKNFVKNRNIFK